MMQVLEVVEAVGKLDGERLKRAQECFESQKGQQRKFLMLRLPDPKHRKGQRDQLNKACHSGLYTMMSVFKMRHAQ